MIPNRQRIIVFLCILILIVTFFLGSYILSQSHTKRSLTFSNDYFSLEMDTVIRRFYVNGSNVLAKYLMFQLEEDYQLNWKLETPNRFSYIKEENNIITVFTFSQLFTYDIFKTFVFYTDKPFFLVEISKTYTIDAFSDNNQILVDVFNDHFVLLNNHTFVFFLLDLKHKLVIQILDSSPEIVIQEPVTTEAQFNFNGRSDRDITFHQKGQIETVRFNVTVANL